MNRIEITVIALCVLGIILMLCIFNTDLEKDYRLERDQQNLEYIRYLFENAHLITAGEIDASVIEVFEIEAKNYKNRPSYCSINGYKIGEINGKYWVLFKSGGSAGINNPFKSLEEAKKEVIKLAEDSNKRWLNSHGLEY